jgi:hypothetical protein
MEYYKGNAPPVQEMADVSLWQGTRREPLHVTTLWPSTASYTDTFYIRSLLRMLMGIIYDHIHSLPAVSYRRDLQG